MNSVGGEKFWTWSLEHYARDGVEPLLLNLQEDFQADINILLWLCWSAEDFETAPDLVIRKAIEQTFGLNQNVTQRLRSARQFLKTWHGGASSNDASILRAHIKDIELEAEKVEQALLESLARESLSVLSPGDRHNAADRALHNLMAYTAITGISRKNGFSSTLLKTLIGHIFSNTDGAVIRKKGT
ncbi:MAG: hypothetical protein DHS20C05_07420 [Hyphococcus sp.]|nr:MAG: hypothetical protein DHS20C05_07420 [Marinicaulis sp.]